MKIGCLKLLCSTVYIKLISNIMNEILVCCDLNNPYMCIYFIIIFVVHIIVSLQGKFGS